MTDTTEADRLAKASEAMASSDAADAALAASGDPHAFERLYREHVSRIHSLARRMVGGEGADEVTQDVFVRAWEKLHTFRGEARFGTWLHRLAINVMLGFRQSAGRHRERFDSSEAALETLSRKPKRVDLVLDFENAIAVLPEGAREVFVLHDIEGFKHREIGEMLGITAGTSKAQLHRARMTLREHLDR